MISPWYCSYIMKRISAYEYQPYVNAISKSYIRNLILLRYIILHRPDIALMYKKIIAKSEAWYLHDIAYMYWKGYPLTYISTMSMQYPNPISETWYCSNIFFISPRYCFDIRTGHCLIWCLISPLYRSYIMKRISHYPNQNYFNAISKSYIRNLILQLYECCYIAFYIT